MMFQIYSFICNPEKELGNHKKEEFNFNSYFIDINDEERMYRIKDKLDINYLNGAIIMKYKEEVMMDYTEWDIIDQLWSYWINILEELSYGGSEVEVYFPDQPIKIQIRDKIDYLDVSIGERQFSLPHDALLYIIQSAYDFFMKMDNYFDGYYSNEINRIEVLFSNSVYLNKILKKFVSSENGELNF